MSRSAVLAQISREPDRSVVGLWSLHVLRSAFQPIYAFRGGKLEIVAYEGLLRPFRNGRPVSPGLFFPKVPPAERMHVETLSRTIHLLNAGEFLDPSASIFINFDPSVFVERELTEATLRDLRLVLHEAGIDYSRIVCEVTEQHTSSETMLFEFVAALRDKGFRIAVDDYGAADSDMHRIEQLHPDLVKFDAKWTNQLMGSGPGLALLSTMVSTFKAAGIVTVFEGIEFGWQLELAEAAGAQMVQGYALARPDIVPGNLTNPAVEQLTATHDSPIQTVASAQPPPAVRTFGKRGVDTALHSRD